MDMEEAPLMMEAASNKSKGSNKSKVSKAPSNKPA